MLTEEKIAELKSKHGDKLAKVETPAGDLIFKPPTREAYDRWSDGIAGGKQRSASNRELAQHCLVYPDHAGLVSVLDVLPGILNAEVADACTMFSGLAEKYDVKKL